MKKIFVAIVALATLTLAGCAEKRENVPVDEVVSSTVTSTTAVEDTTSTVTESKPTEVEKPVSSSSTTTTTKPVENKPTEETSKPSSSSTTSSNKPVEEPTPAPAHTHSFSKATCTTLATCACGATQGTLANHNFSNGFCTTCGKSDPSYVAPHNCNKDGHIWGNSYTKTETTSTTIEEVHDISSCGFDFDLARRYFGKEPTLADFDRAFGFPVNFGSNSTMVKTTATKTTTKYYHDCTKCGKSEQYDTTETVDPGTNWVRVKPADNPYYSTIWYDINNVPQSVLDGAARDQADLDDWLANLAASM